MTVENKFNTNRLFALTSENETFEFSLPLKEEVVINGNKCHIVLEYDKESNAYFIECNNRTYPVEVIRKQQNKYEILFNNISRTINVETPFSLQRIKNLESSDRKSEESCLKAPMPGKIIDILPGVGNKVLRGETIIILEAMKMENEILSPITGTIAKIVVKTGENVMKDDILVEIKAV